MKIPSSVKIGAFNYDVNFVDGIMSDEHRFGELFPRKLEINIERTLNPQRYWGTFLHEVIEAINCENELEISHHVIEVLTNNLLGFLYDNKFLKE